MRKRVIVQEEHFMTREELFARAYNYAKTTGESLSYSARLNGVNVSTFQRWLDVLGVRWKKDKKKQETKEKIEYLKKHQDQTLKEVCKEKKWSYSNLRHLLIINFYTHPSTNKIFWSRKIPDIAKLLLEGKISELRISEITETSAAWVKKIREELGVTPFYSHYLTKEAENEIIKELKKGNSVYAVKNKLHHGHEIVRRIKNEMK